MKIEKKQKTSELDIVVLLTHFQFELPICSNELSAETLKLNRCPTS